MDRVTLASMIDQTLLKPTVGFGEAAAWMDAQRDAGYASLCVSPFLVPVATMRLAGTSTKVCSVCAFPLGYAMTESKAEEAAHLVDLGCAEVDVVMNVAAFLEGERAFVVDDLHAVCESVRDASEGAAIVKVILETGYLPPERVGEAALLAVQAGAAFVKTSTGFGPRGASAEDVRAMRAAVGPDIGVKAAGGIRGLASALALIEAGATRLGTSAGAELVAALPE
jgi:deoxyribose-phosphate aldolase